MPYSWREENGHRALLLWPHRSLPPRGFAGVILAAAGLIALPLFPLLGSAALWGLLPFLVGAIWALWWGLRRSYRDGRLTETLQLRGDLLRLVRAAPGADPQVWECAPHWTRLQIHPTGGPVPHYLTLRGCGREVELGAFLSEEERKILHGELDDALRALRPA